MHCICLKALFVDISILIHLGPMSGFQYIQMYIYVYNVYIVYNGPKVYVCNIQNFFSYHKYIIVQLEVAVCPRMYAHADMKVTRKVIIIIIFYAVLIIPR